MNKQRHQIFLHPRTAAFILIFSFFSVNAFALEIAGVRFNESYLDQGVKMSLQGAGLKTMFLFKAFAAGFYKAQGDDSDLLGNYPKRIEAEYFVNIPGEKLNNFTIETMRKNVTEDEWEFLKTEIKQMGEYFVDLKAGDRFSLTYIPAIGTQFSHNGNLVGTIKGIEFAKALFSVWIGENPFDDRLKEQVLGKNKAV